MLALVVRNQGKQVNIIDRYSDSSAHTYAQIHSVEASRLQNMECIRNLQRSQVKDRELTHASTQI